VLGLFIAIFAGIIWAVIVSVNPVVPLWLRIAVFSLMGGVLLVLFTVALEQKKIKTSVREIPSIVTQSQILLLNTSDIPCQEIKEILGLVKGNTIFAIWLGNDLSALVRLVLGGELIEYTTMMGKARKVATA
jgi:hypothetical protein